MTDQIALRASQAALRRSEARLRLVLDSAVDYAIITTDADGCITGWNRGAENLLGWAELDALGQPLAIIYTPEDATAGIPMTEMSIALSQGRGKDERWHNRRDGQLFWASGEVMPMIEDGACAGFLKVPRDRTPQREAEERLRESEEHYRTTIELGPTIEWTADVAGKVTAIPNRLLALTGRSREDGLGDGWMGIPFVDDLPRMLAAWQRAVTTGERYDIEVRLRLAGGVVRWFRVRAAPRRRPDGAVLRWYGTVEDVHDRKIAEEALRRALADKATLVEEVHHRVKNSLQMVQNLLTLQARVLQAAGSEAAVFLADSAARVQTIGTVHAQLYQRAPGSKWRSGFICATWCATSAAS